MNTTNELIDRARFLRNAAPQAFTDFHAAFARYTATVAELMIAADGNLQLYQGHAQQCSKILRVLEDAKNG
jgi:hypothetical protein